MASLIGKEIGKYRITERLGQGGMAEVYAGIHTHLDRKVAVKVLHSYLLEGGDFVARFKREAKAVANLRHPNIVQVYDFDIQDDLIFMVMEYVDGVNLHTKLVQVGNRGERMPIKLIGSIINDIASALDYAHTKDMLHRDIKPSNIMLDSEDKAYLTDFGIAKLLSDQKFTATGTLVGTPAYMSPEQSLGDDVSKESDIYSLGVVAFEMLTGQVPYDAKTPIGIVHKQINDPIPNMTELVDGVPGTAQEVIDRALAKAPESRFSSAEDLVGALRTALAALESTDPITVPAEESPTVVDDSLEAPTVTMKAEEMEQATVVMEPDKKKEEQLTKEPKAKKTKPAPKVQGEKKKIPIWAFIAGAVGILAIIGVILTQVIDFGGATSETSSAAKPTSQLSSSSADDRDDQTSSSSSSSDDETNDDGPSGVPGHPSEPVEILFDHDHQDEGLWLDAGGNTDYEILEIQGDQVFRSGFGEALPADDGNDIGDLYLNFWIDDDLLFDLPPGGITKIEVEYYDLASEYDLTNHWFILQYDAHSGGENGDGSYKELELIPLDDTGELRSIVFEIADAKFANRINGSDFRLHAGDGTVTIRRVHLSYIPPEFDPDSPEDMSGEDLFWHGEEIFGLGDIEGALDYFNRAIEAGYETGYLYHMKAWAHQNLGQLEESRDNWSIAIELEPENYEYWMERGWRKFDLDDLPGAIEDIKHARELAPEEWGVQFSLGLIYYLSEEDQYKDESHEAFDQAIALEPNNPASRKWRGELKLFRYENPESALEDLNIAVEYAADDNPGPLNLRGLAYLQLEEWDLCIDDYTRAIEIVTDNPWYYLERGDCFVGKGDNQAAREDYQHFLDLADGDDFREQIDRVEEWWNSPDN